MYHGIQKNVCAKQTLYTNNMWQGRGGSRLPDGSSVFACGGPRLLYTRKRVTYIDSDEELFPGIQVIMLPGHTPCILGMVLHLESGTLIFPSDATNEARNYSGMLPGGVLNSIGYLESIKKIK